jgi:hypothetical protein
MRLYTANPLEITTNPKIAHHFQKIAVILCAPPPIPTKNHLIKIPVTLKILLIKDLEPIDHNPGPKPQALDGSPLKDDPVSKKPVNEQQDKAPAKRQPMAQRTVQ